MRYLLSLVALVVALAPVVRAADEPENPFKNAKVGDYAEYKMNTILGGNAIEAKMKMTVTAKTDKEVTLKTTATFMGKEQPGQETKIDLTKPFDALNTAGLPKDANAKVEKLGDGKEDIKLGDKKYACTWSKLKVSTKVGDQDFNSEIKVWLSKDIPLSGLVKMEMTSQIINMTMEYTGSGSEKK